jgi:hypothetical protein
VLVGHDDRLHAVAQAQLGEDPRDVGLHGRLGEEQLARDLDVRAPAGDEEQHLELALGELGEVLANGGAALPLSTFGGPIVAGAYWMALGAMLAADPLERREAEPALA